MAKDIAFGSFIWDKEKEERNKKNHHLDFKQSSQAFKDPHRIISVDEVHSHTEERHFCIGKVEGKVATVRFTYRHGKIRIIGAGYWRKGRKFYEKDKKKKE